MSRLIKFVVPEFVFGEGARKLTGQYAFNLGARKVLLVTDPGVIAAGWWMRSSQALKKRDLFGSGFFNGHP